MQRHRHGPSRSQGRRRKPWRRPGPPARRDHQQAHRACPRCPSSTAAIGRAEGAAVAPQAAARFRRRTSSRARPRCISSPYARGRRAAASGRSTPGATRRMTESTAALAPPPKLTAALADAGRPRRHRGRDARRTRVRQRHAEDHTRPALASSSTAPLSNPLAAPASTTEAGHVACTPSSNLSASVNARVDHPNALTIRAFIFQNSSRRTG